MKCYWLAQHIHYCLVGDHLVLLDVKSDRYMAVHVGDICHLAAKVNGWEETFKADLPKGQTMRPVNADPEQELLARGYLTSDPKLGKLAAPVSVVPVTSMCWCPAALGEDLPLTLFPLGPQTTMRFFAAAGTALVQRRRSSLEMIIDKIESKRKGHSGSSLERATELAVAFHRLRPFLYTANRRCFFDSLACVTFLALHGVFAQWVFGVRLHPFGAHCWVQAEGVLLNDATDRIQQFTPIMVV